MRAHVLLAAAILAATPAFAKDDTPIPENLALASPWHSKEASTTKIELRCGKELSTYELRTDDRDAQHLIGPKWEAISAPFGRFIKTNNRWRKIALDEWLEKRDHGLSFRELTGAPVLPETWKVTGQAREEDATISVNVTDQNGQKRTLIFDVLSGVWTKELWAGKKWLEVRETKQVGVRMLPAKIEVGALAQGCTMTRTITAGGAPLVLPSRTELGLE